MSEEQDALDCLREAGVLAGIGWAAKSAYARTMQDYDPEAGHGPGWVGYTAHDFLKDRQDRVFSCGRYTVSSPTEASAGMDVVAQGLLPGEYDAMPRIEPGLVTRFNLNSSPGWRFANWRWLQTSFTFGHVDEIPWPQKSPTKQRVAAQPDPDPQPTLFDADPDFAEFVSDLVEAEEDTENLVTLVLAHAVQKELNVRELFLGRSRLNPGGGMAWYWKHDLLDYIPEIVDRKPQPIVPAPRPGSEAVADATVRLRRQKREGDSK
ncbi:hypothetical protein ACH4VR_15890 [Streptomyces sp. NPDC020883]|uniref:hypothetical protein n=1 Tax=Streptomyces sp. NPDC020883 TaxID=3365099 RepID=UPI00379A384F